MHILSGEVGQNTAYILSLLNSLVRAEYVLLQRVATEPGINVSIYIYL